jgi:G patch domain-containing protein 1
MVARCGKHIEDFYKEKSKASPQFLFLDGGDGCSYYARKLWEHQQKFIDQQRPDSVKSKPSSDKLTAENRGNILGERPLDRSAKSSSTSFSAKAAVQLQSNLGDTFVKPISLVCFSVALFLPIRATLFYELLNPCLILQIYYCCFSTGWCT